MKIPDTLSFSTKAGTLVLLQDKLKTASIAPIVYFSVGDWKRSKKDCLAKLQLDSSTWIVRSSCSKEDGMSESNAGAFLSLQNVTHGELESAVDKVIESYSNTLDTDEILIQPMLKSVVRAGVVFSHDPNTCSPYRVINWSEGSSTTVVTGGQGGRTWQGAASSLVIPPSELIPVLALLDELLLLFGGTPLDCEFAVTQEKGIERLWLLQTRPLLLPSVPGSPELQARHLSMIADKVSLGMRKHPFLMGRRTVYGIMPDWNPAEIIGVRPKPLALSLYRELVTDAIWAYQRHNYGYRNLRSFPLMPHFLGLPYIDVRLSFNSFIPSDLNDNLAGRLVDYYIDRLLTEPTLHDKVEFEIVFSCYTLDLPQRLERLAEAGFVKEERKEIGDSLQRLTNRIIDSKDGLWRFDANKLEILNQRRETLLASDAVHLERIYWLLEDAKRYGTLPFAGLARAGFMAVQMLHSLVDIGVFSQSDYDAFMSSISTVNGQLQRDRALLDKATFLSRYGHLRPGTYDILSPRYDEAPDLYFDWEKKPPVPEPASPFSLTLAQMREIVKLLDVHGLRPDGVGLFDFLQAGIEQRELAKFHFTRNLSDSISLIADFGKMHGFSREDMAYCDIAAIMELYVAAADPVNILSHSIEQGRARYKETLSISLPPVISKAEDVWAFEWPEASPNFITQKQVTAQVTACMGREHLAGSIVCIPNADPGFDWLFAHPIAGLITAWGGANSHMAIRAAEQGLPALIGAGEVLYRKLSQAKRIHMDCAGRRVEALP